MSGLFVLLSTYYISIIVVANFLLLSVTLLSFYQSSNYQSLFVRIPRVMEVAEEKNLIDAAKKGDTGVLEQLPIMDPDILMVANQEGDTPCHVAIEHGQLEFAWKICLLYPKILSRPNMIGDTPLHCVLRYEHPEFLIECIYLYCQYADSSSAKDRASLYLHWDQAVMNMEGKSLLYLAVEKGYIEATTILLNTPFLGRNNSGPNGTTALHVAVSELDSSNGPLYVDITRLLLQHEPQLARHQDRHGDTPLHHAIYYGSVDKICELLRKQDSSIASILNNDGLSPIHLAASIGLHSAFQLFMQDYPSSCLTTTSRGQNALHIAVGSSSDTIVRMIIEHNKLKALMINQQDDDGNTPVHLAAFNNSTMLQVLKHCGAKLQQHLKNKEGLSVTEIVERRISWDQKKKKMETKLNIESKLVKAMEDFQSSLLVMATLITTVTFTAAFTIPGGYNGNEPNQGMATLVGSEGFKVFMVSDTISFCSSIVAIAALILFSMIFSTEQRFNSLQIAMGAIVVSIVFMLVAFVAGTWVAIGSECRWLVVFIAVVTCCTPLCLTLVVAHIISASRNEVED